MFKAFSRPISPLALHFTLEIILLRGMRAAQQYLNNSGASADHALWFILLGTKRTIPSAIDLVAVATTVLRNNHL